MRPLVEPIRTVIDGVPTYYADVDTPFVATLAFRVSRADERLTNAGITHLAEHIAMPVEEVHGVETNASVQVPWTLFWAGGPPASAAEHLVAVAENLLRPPLERVETERRILETEAARGGRYGAMHYGYSLRFGARGYGVVGHVEHGLHAASAEDVAAWTKSFFTRGNAVLWLTGPPPDELRVVLPDGPRRAPPTPEPIPYLELPAVYEGYGGDEVVLTMVAPRSWDIGIAVEIAQRRLLRALRYELGITYSVTPFYEDLTAQEAHIALIADTLEANATGVRDRFVETVRELAAHGPTEEELTHQVAYFERELRDPHSCANVLAFAAREELLGGEPVTAARMLGEYQRVTTGSVASALTEALESALLLAPPGTGTPVEGFAPYPLLSPRAIDGKRFRLRGVRVRRDPREPVLVAGGEGVALEAPTYRPAVPFDECEIVLVHSEGTRVLWSSDGFYVEVDPSLWRGGDEVVALIDAHAPEGRVVRADPERAARVDAVAEAVENRIKRNWMTNDELGLLPELLRPDEALRIVARASKGWRPGVLAVTDRRLLFLYFSRVLDELPLESVDTVHTEGRGRLSEKKVTVYTDASSVTFTGIKGATLDELEDAIRGG